MEFHPPPPLTNTIQPSTSPSTTTPTVSQQSLPYLISRTPTANLPVYEHTKGGGTKHITVVRKLSGDLSALQLHLREALGLEEGYLDAKGRKKQNVTINWTTRQVVVRGWRGAEVKRWCELAGF